MMPRACWYLAAVALCLAWTVSVAVAAADEEGRPELAHCLYTLAETIPNGLEAHDYGNAGEKRPFEADVVDTAEAFLALFRSAKSKIQIASYYWRLTDAPLTLAGQPWPDPDQSQRVGRQVLDLLREAAQERQVEVEIVNDSSMSSGRSISYQKDLEELEQFAQVHHVNMTQLFDKGVLHSNFILVDSAHFYLGSANMDWRSLSHTKELGLYVEDCAPLALELDRIFQSYKRLASANNISVASVPSAPTITDRRKRTALAKEVYALAQSDSSWFNPLHLLLEGAGGAQPMEAEVNIAAAPENMKGYGRSYDLNEMVLTIKNAKRFVYVSAMDYHDAQRFMEPIGDTWSVLFNVLAQARRDGLDVRVLVDGHSLDAGIAERLSKAGIQYRGFSVPTHNAFEKNLMFARLYQNKYLVTDEAVVVTSQNLTPEYFNNALGISLVVKNHLGLVQQMKQLFERDFTSSYSHLI